MAVYEGFASVYDIFMADTDYDGWVRYLQEIWKRYHQTPKMVADLGCGTGNICLRLAKLGYEMIGIDLSWEMLCIARQKIQEQNLDVLLLEQDMRQFELYGTVDCIISLYDSLNYITEKEELLEVFRLCNNYLNPGGLFIFDLNTPYKFEQVLSDNTFAQTTEHSVYVWENDYDKESKLNEFYMNFFVEDLQTGQYNRFEEYHYERAYSLDTIQQLLKQSGMQCLDIFDAYTFLPPKEDSQRVYVIAKEQGK